MRLWTGVVLPYQSSSRSSGAMLCSTTMRESGRRIDVAWSSRSVSPATPAGVSTDHALGSSSSSLISSSTSIGVRRIGQRVTADREVELDVDEEELEARVAAREPRIGALDVHLEVDPEQLLAARAHGAAGGDVGDDPERVELEQDVEVEPAGGRVVHEQELDGRRDVEAASELHAVRRHREVRGQASPAPPSRGRSRRASRAGPRPRPGRSRAGRSRGGSRRSRAGRTGR